MAGGRDEAGHGAAPVTAQVTEIVVVDDVPEVREMVAAGLRASQGFTVVAEGANGLEAVELASRHRPALMLLDVSMPGMDGLEALPQVLRASPATRVVMFSGFDPEGLADRAMALGASDFVDKGVPLRELAERLASALRPRSAHAVPPQEGAPVPPADAVEAVVAEHRERFRGVFKEAAIGMATMTLAGRVVRANAAFARLLGWTQQELVGCTYDELVDQADVDIFAGAVAKLARGAENVVEFEHRLASEGSPSWALSTLAGVQDSAGRPLYLFLQAQDVTLRRAAVDALRASEERFRLLVAGVVDYAIFMLGPDGIVASWNPGAERIHGYTADEALGRHFRLLYTPEAQAERHPEQELAQAVRDGHYEEEGWRVRKDGSRFWANVVITPIFDTARELVGFAKVTRDVTERRKTAEVQERAAEELREANKRLREADELKSEFMAITAHELRNPIAVLGGFASILLDRSHQLEEDERRQLLRGVGTQAARLNRLVEDLLVAARLDAGALEIHRDELDLGPLIEEASGSMGGLDGRPIEVDCSPLLSVVGDRDRLNQMLVNYISNAVKYGAPPLRVEARPKDGFAEVRVLDAGVGVPPDVVPRLFEKFSRATKSATGGTGLGLFIVRGLARAQGGDAWYEPGAPSGACFAFRVPAAARRA